MPTNLGNYFRIQRETKGLNLNRLARLIGYKNDCKGMNRIGSFENHGVVHPDLLKKLMVALDVDPAIVDQLVEQDRLEFFAEWTKWVNTPIDPYLVIRLMPAIYCRKDIPDTVRNIDEAEDYAVSISKRMHCKVCLVLSRRITLWFNSEGVLDDATEAVPGQSNVPTMRLGRGRKRFLVKSVGHDLAIEQVTWPGRR
jgi:hypothetical protein